MSRSAVWPATAVVLGAWETAAIVTRRVPTVSATCWRATRRYGLPARLAVVAWCAGLAAHLLDDKGVTK